MGTWFTEQFSTLWTNSLAETETIMDTPIGGLIYFVLALIIIFFIVWVTVGIIMWAKKMTGQKKKSRGRGRGRR